MVYILGMLFFIVILFLFNLILPLLFVRRQRAIDRVNSYLNVDTKKREKRKTGEKLDLKDQISRLIVLSGKGINNIKILNKIKENSQREMTSAGIPLKGEEFIAIQIFLFVLTFLVSLKATGILVGSLILGVISLFIAKNFVKSKKNKRIKLFNDQLGDAIVLISNSLKVGHSFLQAFDSAAKEMPAPIGKEFGKAIKEMKLGISTEKSLQNILDRIESDDLELMNTAISIQRQTGGNLSEILDTIAKTIRERIKIKGEIKTLTAQGRLSGLVITFIPIVIGIAFFMINPDYIKLLFTTKIGLVLVGVSIVSEIIGYMLINKIVNIQV